MLELQRSQKLGVSERDEEDHESPQTSYDYPFRAQNKWGYGHEFCKKLKKSHWIRSKAEGFSRGIWMLWDEDDVKIELRYIHKQFVHVAVQSAGRQS